MSKFTHLHSHTHFSLLNALPKVPELIDHVKKDGATALALTDDGVMYGAIKFYETCKNNDIKPIIGVDFYVALRTRHDKQSRIDNKRYRLVLLAKNENGYRNLMKLVSVSFIEGYYYKPRIDRELLEKYSKDLIAIIPQFSGETSGHLTLNNKERATEAYDFYSNIFKDDLYFEVLHHPEIDGQEELKEKIINFTKEKGAKLVATSDFYYLEKEDKKARDVLVEVSSMGRSYSNETDDFSIRSEKEMEEIFKDVPEAISNTKEIEEKCNLELEFGVWHFPLLPEIPGKTFDDRLREWCFSGLEKRGMTKNQEAIDRLNYELDVIKMKGFSAYFLIVADFLKAAADRNILTAIRGSVAGSLTTYVTEITHLNPFEYKLPFERFLNPERPSAPDIDMDFASDGRDEMLDYAREKYGVDKVAQIGTFGTMAARGAVKDAARAMGFPYSLGDQIAKLIPMFSSLKDATSDDTDLKKLYDNEEDVRKVVDMAIKIEGSARHISVHAAGVVIAPDDLTYYTPLQVDQKSGKIITQYDMHAVGEDYAGLIKFDFLGINILKTIAETLKRIEKIHQTKIDIQKIPFDDPRTYKMLTAGYTQGVFQLASEGMTKWLHELKPKNIHDINAMLALYRPGAMAFIPEYIARKENPKLVKFVDPRMKKWLEDSYGLMVYQDDVMRMAIELAGYSWLEADKFRKAMGKKKAEVMAEQEKKFKTGCLKGGMEKPVISKLWDEIVEFAQYGFNKAHSASYGRIAYQTAWLKANYPAEYMSALLSTNDGNADKVAAFSEESKKMGIPVLPPHINYSFKDFGVVKGEDNETGKDQIRFGLRSIKNFGDKIADFIVKERKENGRYKTLEGFMTRMRDGDLNKKSLEALILSGTLDVFGTRSELIGNVENLLALLKDIKDTDKDQESLFSVLGDEDYTTIKLDNVEGKILTLKTGMNNDLTYTLPLTQQEELFWEKELLGLFVSSHPLEKYREKMEREGKTIAMIKKRGINSTYTIAGVVEELKEILTKKGDKMAFVKISDFSGMIEIVVFPKTWKEYSEIIKVNETFAFKGKLERKEDDHNFILDKMKKI